jgi:hypothetical protein
MGMADESDRDQMELESLDSAPEGLAGRPTFLLK